MRCTDVPALERFLQHDSQVSCGFSPSQSGSSGREASIDDAGITLALPVYCAVSHIKQKVMAPPNPPLSQKE